MSGKVTHTISVALDDDYGKQFPIGTKAIQVNEWRPSFHPNVNSAMFRAKGQMIVLFDDEVTAI
jgi:hypothetical protein